MGDVAPIRRGLFAILCAIPAWIAAMRRVDPLVRKVDLDGGLMPPPVKVADFEAYTASLQRRGFHVYDVGGQTMFPIYSRSGFAQYWVKRTSRTSREAVALTVPMEICKFQSKSARRT